MRLEGAPEIVKMACGENPKRVYGGKGGAPSTRMGNLRGFREAFLGAVEYRKTWQQYEREVAEWKEKRSKASPGSDEALAAPPREPARDLGAETLAGVLEGRILPQVHCYTADDMLSFLQVAEEFEFRVRSFHHAVEAYKIRDILASREVAVSTWADWWGFKVEAYDGIPYNAALVHEAGGRAVIHSDSSIGIQRLNEEASKAYTYGLEAGIELTREDPLRWVTSNPAWALGIDAQVGSIAGGKRGDLVIWNSDPLSVYSRPEKVFMDGQLVYDPKNTKSFSDFVVGQGVAP